MFCQKLFLVLLSFVIDSKCTADPGVYLDQTITAMGRLASFIYNEYENMNIDGYFGLTLAEATLDLALKHTKLLINGSVIDAKTVNRIRDIRNLMRKTRNLIYPLMPEKPFKYYAFKKLLSMPQIWRRDLGYKHGNFSKNALRIDTGPFDVNNEDDFYKYMKNSTFSEEISDTCLVEALTSSEQPVVHDCLISKKCYNYNIFVSNEYNSAFQSYGATHRLLFLQILRGWGCKIDKQGFNELVRQLCGYIYWEAKTLLKYQRDPFYADLIIEQVDLCGFEGFLEFYEEKFIQFVLNQQTPYGCYGAHRSPEMINRQTRETAPMKFGCNSHTTGLAIDGLSSILKYILWSMSSTRKKL